MVLKGDEDERIPGENLLGGFGCLGREGGGAQGDLQEGGREGGREGERGVGGLSYAVIK